MARHTGRRPDKNIRGSNSRTCMARYGPAWRSRSTGASQRPDTSHSTTSGDGCRAPAARALAARTISPSIDIAKGASHNMWSMTTKCGVTCARYYLVGGPWPPCDLAHRNLRTPRDLKLGLPSFGLRPPAWSSQARSRLRPGKGLLKRRRPDQGRPVGPSWQQRDVKCFSCPR